MDRQALKYGAILAGLFLLCCVKLYGMSRGWWP